MTNIWPYCAVRKIDLKWCSREAFLSQVKWFLYLGRGNFNFMIADTLRADPKRKWKIIKSVRCNISKLLWEV